MQLFTDDYLAHHGIRGQKWGVRRFQNKDGTLTSAGKKRYYNSDGSLTKAGKKRRDKQQRADAKAKRKADIAAGRDLLKQRGYSGHYEYFDKKGDKHFLYVDAYGNPYQGEQERQFLAYQNRRKRG